MNGWCLIICTSFVELSVNTKWDQLYYQNSETQYLNNMFMAATMSSFMESFAQFSWPLHFLHNLVRKSFTLLMQVFILRTRTPAEREGKLFTLSFFAKFPKNVFIGLNSGILGDFMVLSTQRLTFLCEKSKVFFAFSISTSF